MAFTEFLGCTLVAFGPALSMFCVSIARCPIRVIIFITAAFYWLVSLLLSSIVWCSTLAIFRPDDETRLVPFGVIEAVLFQELFRYLFYKTLRKADNGLKKLVEVGSSGGIVTDSRETLAYVSGLGFGAISGGFSLLNVLAQIVGPASVGLYRQSEWFVLVSSLTTCFFILLNTAWGVILFHAYDMRDGWLIGGTILTHLACSLVTLMNSGELYWETLIPLFAITLLSVALAFRYAGGRYHKLALIFKRLPETTVSASG